MCIRDSFYLIFKKKNLQRSFQLPGGTPFKAIVAGAGLFMTVATLIISFFPSSNLDAQSNMVYQATLGIAFVISVAIPFVIYALRHRWAPQGPTNRAAVSYTHLEEISENLAARLEKAEEDEHLQ